MVSGRQWNNIDVWALVNDKYFIAIEDKSGGLFGYTSGYEGGQVNFVRVPYADVGPRKLPEGLTDEQVLLREGGAPALNILR